MKTRRDDVVLVLFPNSDLHSEASSGVDSSAGQLRCRPRANHRCDDFQQRGPARPSQSRVYFGSITRRPSRWCPARLGRDTDNLVTVLEREIDSTYLKAQQRGRATGATSQRIFRFIWGYTTV